VYPAESRGGGGNLGKWVLKIKNKKNSKTRKVKKVSKKSRETNKNGLKSERLMLNMKNQIFSIVFFLGLLL
jgi:hypothetical protein